MRASLLLVFVLAAVCQGEKGALEMLANAGIKFAGMPLERSSTDDNVLLNVNPPRHDDLAISRLQKDIKMAVDIVWNSIYDQQRFAILKSKGAAKEVVKMFAVLRNDIFAVDQQVTNSKVELSLRTLAVPPNESESWQRTVENFLKVTGKVSLLYNYLDEYMSSPDNSVSQIVLEDYARSIIQPGSTQETSMLTSLVNLHQMAVPRQMDNEDGLLGGKRRNDIFYKLYSVFRNNRGDICNLNQSPHQLVDNVYNLIALSAVKGYAMVQFSYIMLKLFNKGNFTLEADLGRSNFDTQTSEQLEAIKEILPRISRQYWKCNPKRPREGHTYIRMTQLLQGHLENEVDMSNLGSCKASCSSYKVVDTPKTCFKNLFCAKQPKCNGRLFDCQFFHADAWVCMSSDPNRRYDWIEYENGIKLGRQDQCINKIKVDSWWRWLFWHCSYCLCKCDDDGEHSDRYWSLRPATSDMEANKVVTGVRFVKRKRVIHLEIEQATALPEGSIDAASRQWKKADEIDVNGTNGTTFHQNVDYMMMTYEQRALDTDRLEADVDHVVTGVRLRNLGGHLNLEVRTTYVDFGTGKLAAERSIWIGNDNTPATFYRRTRVDILSPDVPTRRVGNDYIDTNDNQYILFDATSAQKDVSQTTVPYIDAQEVSPLVGTWLSGVGLYHKGTPGFGGFVGALVSTFDVSHHLVPQRKDQDTHYTSY